MTIEDIKKLLIKLKNNMQEYKVKTTIAYSSYISKKINQELYRVIFNIDDNSFSLLSDYDGSGVTLSQYDYNFRIKVPFANQKEKYDIYSLIEEIRDIEKDKFENNLFHFINE